MEKDADISEYKKADAMDNSKSKDDPLDFFGDLQQKQEKEKKSRSKDTPPD